ncbi:MAG: molybdopterin-dependent oxidoreductase [Candidatus Binatia bacterium]
MPKLTRRAFLKLGVMGTSALTFGAYLAPLSKAAGSINKEWVSRTHGRFLQAVPTTCLNCYARCGIFGYVDDGKVVKLGGNPDHPNNRGRMCAKGQAGINLLYDPERILYPLRRVGPRGNNKWRQVSWEEALSEIAGKLKALRDRGRPEEFIFQSQRDITTRAFSRRFCHAFGSPSLLNGPPLGGANKSIARQLTCGYDCDISDVAYTEYILNFGSNPYEAHIARVGFIHRMASTRSIRTLDERVTKRAKLVTFDSRLTQTAGRSDEWFPLKPGTDGLIALAMANVIMEEGLFDKGFLDRWTNYPSDMLAEHLRQYPPELAEKVSGVKASVIRRIAREFATAKPATVLSSGGVTKHENGVNNERCITLLGAVTGNVDVKGGDCFPRTYSFQDPDPQPPVPRTQNRLLLRDTFPLANYGMAERVLPLIREGRQKASVYMTYQHNPAYTNPESKLMMRILGDETLVPFFVAIDSHMSESAALADVVLPAATYLERLELESPPALDMVPLVSIRQPLVKPLGQSKPFMDILIDLAHRVGEGMERYFSFSPQEYWEASLAHIGKLRAAGGLSYLKERGVWFDSEARPNYRSYQREGFKTPSGKFEVYSTVLKEKGFSPLPSYQPISSHNKMDREEMILIVYQSNVHTHDHTANCMYISEIAHTNHLLINSEVAARMGIQQGDRVQVISKVGSLVTEAYPTPGIHPKVVAISDSMGHWAYGNIARAKRFRSVDPNTSLLWWEEEGNGAHANAIIPLAADPIGGGQAWMDATVKVIKVDEVHPTLSASFSLGNTELAIQGVL